jgi:mediator of RNA polymerase II transcription subunit 23
MPNNNATLSMGSDFRIALLLNTYSTNPEYFNRPMAALVDTILGSTKTVSNTSATPALPTAPLSMCILDSLTVHSKMSLIHAIVSHIAKLAQNKTNNCNMAPALVETYSRLLVYTEIESLGIKGFISKIFY